MDESTAQDGSEGGSGTDAQAFASDAADYIRIGGAVVDAAGKVADGVKAAAKGNFDWGLFQTLIEQVRNSGVAGAWVPQPYGAAVTASAVATSKFLEAACDGALIAPLKKAVFFLEQDLMAAFQSEVRNRLPALIGAAVADYACREYAPAIKVFTVGLFDTNYRARVATIMCQAARQAGAPEWQVLPLGCSLIYSMGGAPKGERVALAKLVGVNKDQDVMPSYNAAKDRWKKGDPKFQYKPKGVAAAAGTSPSVAEVEAMYGAEPGTKVYNDFWAKYPNYGKEVAADIAATAKRDAPGIVAAAAQRKQEQAWARAREEAAAAARTAQQTAAAAAARTAQQTAAAAAAETRRNWLIGGAVVVATGVGAYLVFRRK